MLRSGKSALFFLLLFLVIFAVGMLQLFRLRFQEGDVYPVYSSLRPDPLGTKALYESLESLPGLSVRRFHEPLQQIGSGRDTTLFLLGTAAYELRYASEKEVSDLERFMREGGRIVVSLLPENSKGWFVGRKEKLEEKEKGKNSKDSKDSKGSNKQEPKDVKEPGKEKPEDPKEIINKEINRKKEKKKELSDEDGEPLNWVSLRKKWGFDYDYKDLKVDDERIGEPVQVEKKAVIGNLPERLRWHTAVYFHDLDDKWRVIYTRENDEAVLIERPMGKGSLVFSSDSYFLSNEALRKERSVELLTWIAGESHRLIFDETHLGVQNDPGIAALARRYGLQGLAAGFVLLAGLFVWKNATSFVPPYREEVLEGEAALVAGKDSAAGFVNLLRRSVSPAELLFLCVAEWKRSCTHGRKELAEKMKRIEALIREQNERPNKERNSLQSYRDISRILAERKR